MGSLHCEVAGTGPALLFLHPVGLDGDSWLPVTRKLEHSFSTYRLDLPGHGRSPLDGAVRSLADYADDVAASIAQLGIDSFALLGLSFGGMIAQTLAARRPPGLRALVLCGCRSTFPDSLRVQILDRGLKVLTGGMAATVEETLDRWFSPEFRASAKIDPVRRRLMTDDPAAWAAAWTAISQLNTIEELHRVEVPTLCIAGSLDQGSPPATVKETAAAITGARYLELQGAPHMMHLERPVELARAMEDFLADLPGLRSDRASNWGRDRPWKS